MISNNTYKNTKKRVHNNKKELTKRSLRGILLVKSVNTMSLDIEYYNDFSEEKLQTVLQNALFILVFIHIIILYIAYSFICKLRSNGN